MSDGSAVNSNSKTNYQASLQSSKQCFNCSNARQLFLQLAFVSSLPLCPGRTIPVYTCAQTNSHIHVLTSRVGLAVIQAAVAGRPISDAISGCTVFIRDLNPSGNARVAANDSETQTRDAN
ncbi:hypothetical protein CBL_00411 [Carabus blaptoides fortunei]